MADTIPKTAAQEWRSNWTLVLAASFGFSFFSIMLAATAIFIVPLGAEFGWSKTTLSAGAAIATLVTALLGPLFGALIDRFGSRRLVLPGIVLTMASIAGFSTMTGQPWQWYLLWLVFGVVAVSIKSTAWTAAVVGVFSRSRGLALGLTLAGTAVAQMVVPPLVVWLVADFGWRMAFVWLALGWGGLTLLLCFLFFFDLHDRKRASPEAALAETARQAALSGLTRREGLRDSALWRLAISNFVIMALTQGLSFHLFAILTEAGVDKVRAAWLLSLTGLFGIIGKLVTGVLLDRFRPNWVGGITLGAAALAFALLVGGIHSPTMIVLAMVVNGYAFGTKTQITGNLTASYGGMRNFGFLYGIMSSLMALAAGVGPLIAAYSADKLGGYGPFLLTGTVGCVLCGLLMLSLPSYPVFDRKPTER